MKTRNILLASVGAAWLLAGCDVKDAIYNTPHPEHGKVTLAVDWTERAAGIGVPENYTACVGEYSETLSGEENTLNHLFRPGTYRAFVYNVPHHVSVTDKVASVTEIAASGGASGRFVYPNPGWFFSCATDMAVEADKEQRYAVRMHQQMRLLSLEIELTGGSISRAVRMEGTLSGVAGSLDLDSGEHGTASSVELPFEKDTDGKFKATVKVLGMAGGDQKLVAKIYYESDSPLPTSFESDLTMALSGFNSNKNTPFTLGGEAVETPTGAGFTASIKAWKPIAR